MIDWNTSDGRNMGLELSVDTQESIENYLIHGWSPGGFVESMMAHDYERAFATADTANRQTIWVLWNWIRNYAPPLCHGSYKAVDLWRDNVDGRRTAYAEPILKSAVWKKLSTI